MTGKGKILFRSFIIIYYVLIKAEFRKEKL